MKISLDWLREFVAWEGPAEELAARLTSCGLNVEGIAEVGQSFPGVVTARVLETVPHPNADKLTLCRVFDGTQTLEVVCGAANVRGGLDVLLARPGAELPGSVKIKVSQIRGVESQGMICSSRELGLGLDSEGIMELPGEPSPGTAADALYGWRDQVLDIEVTPNRPDWLCHLGVAREVAAITGNLLQMPDLWKPPKSGGDRLDFVVEIEDFADCPRYLAHLARGVKVGPSPEVLRRRLLAIGERPLNNVVDITNYVMFELGQPLHAFDRAKISGARVTVRRAVAGSECTTLDGVPRTLGPEHLIIADGAGILAVAGVMGAARSEIDAGTQEVLLESAFFHPLVVRRAARSLSLSSESSYRFEREADWQMVERAAHRALYLLQHYASARIVPECADRQNPDRPAQPVVPLRVAQVNRLLGTSLEATEVVGLLKALGLKVVPLRKAGDRQTGSASLTVEVPSFRRDLKQEVDLIEEVARLYGYDRIPAGAVAQGVGGARRQIDRLIGACRRYLSAVGYHEIVTSSFMSPGELERLGLAPNDRRADCLAVINPRHGGDTLLRTTLLPSLLNVLRHNVNADCPLPLRLFQANKVYLRSLGTRPTQSHPDAVSLPDEPLLLQVGIAGRADRVHGGEPADLFELKGLLEALSELGRLEWRLEPGVNEPFLTPGAAWRVTDSSGRVRGWAGAVSPSVGLGFGIDVPVAVAEIDLTGAEAAARAPVAFEPFSRFPIVKRDLSLVVPRQVPFADLQSVIREAGGETVASVELFDIYCGSDLPENARALGIRLKFRSARGSLKGKAVDHSIVQITEALARRLSVQLRG